MKRTLRQLLWAGATLLGLGFGPSVFGQDQQPAAASGKAPASGGVTTVNQSNYYLEYGIVLVMFGAALFAVCRSSRRN